MWVFTVPHKRCVRRPRHITDGAYRIDYDNDPVDLLPLGSAHWPALIFMQSPRKINVNVKWTENGQPFEEPQTVYFS